MDEDKKTGLTPEEVEAKIKEAREESTLEFEERLETLRSEYEEKVSGLSEKVEQFEKQKEDMEEGLAETKKKEGPQSENFKTLKAALDKKDEDLKALKEQLDKVSETRVVDIASKAIKQVAGDDEETVKKIQFHMENTLLGMTANSEEEILKKVDAAARLSKVESSPDVLDVARGGVGGASINNPTDASENDFTPQEKELGKRLGISEEDYQKYKGKVSPRTK